MVGQIGFEVGEDFVYFCLRHSLLEITQVHLLEKYCHGKLKQLTETLVIRRVYHFLQLIHDF